MSRKVTHGRFETREELEEFIWTEYKNTMRNLTEIARAAQISPTTVSAILKAIAVRKYNKCTY